MLNKLLTVTALMGAMAVNAQIFKVESIERVTLPSGVAVEEALLSPDGAKVAYTQLYADGVSVLDLANGSDQLISPKGIAMDMAFANNGKTLVYDEVSYDTNHVRRVAVKTTDLTSGETKVLIKSTRKLNGVTVDESGIRTVENGKINAPAARPVLSINLGQLCITRGNKTEVLSPLGTSGMSYLWPSLSPDGKRICFYAAGLGCYTCNVDGSDVKKLGWLRAAKWYDNNTVVGMHDLTDGKFTVSSEIIAYSNDGSVSQTLTDGKTVAMYPSVAEGKIAYSTVDGRLFIINLKK